MGKRRKVGELSQYKNVLSRWGVHTVEVTACNWWRGIDIASCRRFVKKRGEIEGRAEGRLSVQSSSDS